MVDLRRALRPLVDEPGSEPRPVADIAERARRRRARRRPTQAAVGAVGALAIAGLVTLWPSSDGPDTVTDTVPATEGDVTTSPPATSQTTEPPSTESPATEPPATVAPTSEPAEPAPQDDQGDAAGGDSQPFVTLHLEDHDGGAGGAATDTAGGEAVMAQDGAYVMFEDVDLQAWPATRVEVRFASGAGAGSDGLVELRLGGLDAPPFATIPVGDTGAWDTFSTSAAATSGAIGGTHSIYVTFSSSQNGDVALVDWIRFHP